MIWSLQIRHRFNVITSYSIHYTKLYDPSTVADELSAKIITYVLVMLVLVILVHTSVIFGAYQHEVETVRVLERDKELMRQSSEQYALVNRLSNSYNFV